MRMEVVSVLRGSLLRDRRDLRGATTIQVRRARGVCSMDASPRTGCRRRGQPGMVARAWGGGIKPDGTFLVTPSGRRPDERQEGRGRRVQLRAAPQEDVRVFYPREHQRFADAGAGRTRWVERWGVSPPVLPPASKITLIRRRRAARGEGLQGPGRRLGSPQPRPPPSPELLTISRSGSAHRVKAARFSRS
jgi:hypothetical protein